MVEQAFVCGRFQPPHNEHLQYIQKAKSRCRFLWVGIVRPDIRRVLASEGQGHRQAPSSNPLTYFERSEILRRALLDLGLGPDEFACTPFPLDEDTVLHDFMPVDVLCLTTDCEPWNQEKRQKLEAAGYRVEVLLKRDPSSKLEGSRIRAAIVRGSTEWESQVPPATKEAVYRLGLRERLLALGLTT